MHEAIISLNVGFVVMLLIFGTFGQVDYFAPLERRLYDLDGSINTLFHIQNTDLATNHFVFFIFALAIALCVWIFLRLISGTHFVGTILGPVAGVFALVAIPLMTIKSWHYAIESAITYPAEIVIVLYFAFQVFARQVVVTGSYHPCCASLFVLGRGDWADFRGAT